MGMLDWLFGPKQSNPQWTPIRSPETSGSCEPLRLAPSVDYSFVVVGESHRQDVLDSICGGKCGDGHNIKVTAQLLVVEDNPYDPNAVGVFVDRKLVGYIPRDVAPLIRSELLKLDPDERPVTCDANIRGGWDRGGGDEGSYGIWLNVATPLRVTA